MYKLLIFLSSVPIEDATEGAAYKLETASNAATLFTAFIAAS